MSERRVPYFERPKPPHDWRWVVGLIGRTLIVLGVLMFAFVAYQLWGTGIQTAQAQDDLRTEFDQVLQSSTSTTTTTTSTTAPVGSTTPDTTPASTTTTIPVAPNTEHPQGAPIALLRIPKIGLDKAVVEGVGVADLKKGPGHFPETPMPGQLGNAAIAGHRTTYGQPFFRLDELAPGDRIEVDTMAGTYVYVVTGSIVVNPSEYAAVIPTVDPDVATLTLATCTPRYTARQRLIVQAELVVEESAQVFRPPSATLPDDGSTSSTDDTGTTLPGEDTTSSTATPDTTDSTGTTTSSTDGTGTVAPVTTAPPSTQSDAFTEGWFHDTGAIVPAILWGLALAAVAVGAWFVGKKANRLWVSWLVGAVPFVVVLYFFFENINRLLPPGI